MSKTILISGGSDGLGKAIAARLAPKYHVVILSPHEEKLRKVAGELHCDYKVCDVRDYAQVKKVINEIGAVDCLVNNAGLWIEGPLTENDPDYSKQVLEVNVLGVINLTKAVVPGMKEQKSGLIININSQAGFYAKAERSVYTASKWAITGFTKAIQPELESFGIAVTGIYPGKMRTEMFSKMNIDKKMEDALDTEYVAKTIEFLLSLEGPVMFPEIGIKNIEN